MPKFDKTGPRGMGPRTGRGLGCCGMGMGMGYGCGCGFGNGCFGCPFCSFGNRMSKSGQQKYLEEKIANLESYLDETKKVLEELKKTA